jgi:hypothetical protein
MEEKMKKIIVRHGSDGTVITAPEGKTMAIDNGMLQHGVLMIGEYGASGIKVAAFMDWSHALLIDDGDEGYSIKVENPF